MEPELLKAQLFEPGDIGLFAWNTELNKDDLEYSQESLRATWAQAHMSPGAVAPRIWVPVQSLARLHSGDFRWDFEIERIGQAQIGVGFLLDWTVGPDWGFYGYLGSSSSAWAYDPTSGDVVYATRSIEGGLPVLSDGEGVVSLEAHLPREQNGLVRFLVNGKSSQAIELPEGAVIVPAACFLEVGQIVTLANFQTSKLEPSSWPRETPEFADETPSVPTSAEAKSVPKRKGLLSRLLAKLRGQK